MKHWAASALGSYPRKRVAPRLMVIAFAGCAYMFASVRQGTLAAILLVALFTTAARLPSSPCAVASAPIGKACRPGCCANKACCAESQKNHSLPSQPLIKDTANHELTAIAAPTVAIPNFSIQSSEALPCSQATHFARSAPAPALLCTFLI